MSYVPESNIRVKSYDHSNLSRASVVQFRGHNISRRSKLNNGSSRQIRMVITFHSDVWFEAIKYRDARNWTTEALEKFEWSYLFTGCPIRVHNSSRRSELNNWSSREIRMVITFHTDMRFADITHLDSRNWTTEALDKFECSLLFTRMSDSVT